MQFTKQPRMPLTLLQSFVWVEEKHYFSFIHHTFLQKLQYDKGQKSKEEILNQFKAKYYDEKVKSIYPVDAMELNTNIMINLIEKELFKNEFFDKR